MTLITVIDMYDGGLEGYRKATARRRWHLALEGYSGGKDCTIQAISLTTSRRWLRELG